MIGYTTLGTADLAKSGAFYDVLLGSIGAKRFTQESVTVGNGIITAIALETPEQVKTIYNKALGGSCEGQSRFRPVGASSGFYTGYFRDQDSNKLNAFCIVQ